MSLLDFESDPNTITRTLTDNVTVHIVKNDAEQHLKPSDGRGFVKVYLRFWCFDTICIFPKIELYRLNENGKYVLMENKDNEHQYSVEIDKHYVFRIGKNKTKNLMVSW